MVNTSLSLASFFTIEAKEYTNFSLDTSSLATLRNAILALAIGIILASLYAFYQKNVSGAFVRALLRAEAFSEETAKTVEELGFAKNPFVLFEIKHNTMLKRVIARKTAEENGEEGAPAAYYVPEELKYRAELRYQTKGNGPMALIITSALAFVMAVLLIRLLPALLTVFDNLLKK